MSSGKTRRDPQAFPQVVTFPSLERLRILPLVPVTTSMQQQIDGVIRRLVKLADGSVPDSTIEHEVRTGLKGEALKKALAEFDGAIW